MLHRKTQICRQISNFPRLFRHSYRRVGDAWLSCMTSTNRDWSHRFSLPDILPILQIVWFQFQRFYRCNIINDSAKLIAHQQIPILIISFYRNSQIVDNSYLACKTLTVTVFEERYKKILNVINFLNMLTISCNISRKFSTHTRNNSFSLIKSRFAYICTVLFWPYLCDAHARIK